MLYFAFRFFSFLSVLPSAYNESSNEMYFFPYFFSISTKVNHVATKNKLSRIRRPERKNIERKKIHKNKNFKTTMYSTIKRMRWIELKNCKLYNCIFIQI